MSPPRRRDIAGHGVGGEEEGVGVAAGGQHDGMGRVAGNLASEQIAHHDARGFAVDHNHVDEFGAVVQFHVAQPDLAGQLGVHAQQELLSGLASCVERAGDLSATE